VLLNRVPYVVLEERLCGVEKKPVSSTRAVVLY
jgi:hypothetical protein